MSMTQRVLVTGGGRGVGAAIVRSLALAGFEVVFTVRTASAEAQALIADIHAEKPDAVLEARSLDLADKAAVETFAAQLAEEPTYYGFVHNAGMSYDTLAVMVDQTKAEQLMQVNYWSFVKLVGALVRPMTRARTGRIIAIGSIAAEVANAGNAIYAGSKAALAGYCRTLAIESARRGVTVNVVAPGFVDTAMLVPYAAYRANVEKQIPAGRFAAPADVGALVAFLASPGASYITGTTLPVDGGLTAALAIQR
ncbi:NAD(P)-dependent dehydrogenase (short-subunit alcohol dehydrogenase family) [Angulomicrobium tetraedrale]|uniref:NAD(P)-dependent dehydrogenase (Short-subunit alcohol dehydrogenase family) n=1 Tax=Ancylobacter tetraedralis TaxID=217068 RepID=A0A839Z028_9HYPH|nr:SDR family NAD(P)-dependent oxidoreductase [Ancylobacter tetraedralis]MBB3770114.1 NAD(P)-dependent dehydrogenase (short-subunit alcohol dehydrogenase family) [Ancylobacter tetraedralis]